MSNNIKNIAQLANIELGEDLEVMQNKLFAIVNASQILQEINTDGIEPFKHIHLSQQTLREDIIESENVKDELAKCAPHFNKDGYQIPIVLTNTGK